ncbi:hypothetical protein [Dongshaea marina]|uniref:hypothetical protein n=1 Tax=Dongshaea marina TaxID=2047966 RepID=UPI000D3E4D90|nr:hypothetical protein [Dongshaea marina]
MNDDVRYLRQFRSQMLIDAYRKWISDHAYLIKHNEQTIRHLDDAGRCSGEYQALNAEMKRTLAHWEALLAAELEKPERSI